MQCTIRFVNSIFHCKLQQFNYFLSWGRERVDLFLLTIICLYFVSVGLIFLFLRVPKDGLCNSIVAIPWVSHASFFDMRTCRTSDPVPIEPFVASAAEPVACISANCICVTVVTVNLTWLKMNIVIFVQEYGNLSVFNQ